MPAITAETASLAQLPPERHDQRDRPVRTITTAPRGFEGEGFPVRRAFAGVPLEWLDPFLPLDQMGEVDYGAGEPQGTPATRICGQVRWAWRPRPMRVRSSASSPGRSGASQGRGAPVRPSRWRTSQCPRGLR